jgi:hypothetical protein
VGAGNLRNEGGPIRDNKFIDGNAGEKLGEGNLRGAVEERLGVLPEPAQAASKRGSLKAQFASSNKPFTAAWYADHPNAWQYTHPHADAWAVATLAGATAWLGWAATPAYSYGTYYSDTSTEVISQEATELADNGTQEVATDGEWLNIGTYALGPKGQATATMMLSLTVNKDGVLRGTYLDLLSNSAQTIQGAIDKESQRVAWRIGAGGRVTFQTTLSDLTAATTPVSLQFDNGKTALWTMARQAP